MVLFLPLQLGIIFNTRDGGWVYLLVLGIVFDTRGWCETLCLRGEFLLLLGIIFNTRDGGVVCLLFAGYRFRYSWMVSDSLSARGVPLAAGYRLDTRGCEVCSFWCWVSFSIPMQCWIPSLGTLFNKKSLPKNEKAWRILTIMISAKNSMVLYTICIYTSLSAIYRMTQYHTEYKHYSCLMAHKFSNPN